MYDWRIFKEERVDFFGPILLAAIGVMIVASIWLTSERYSNRQFHDEESSYQPKPPSIENIDGRLSPDFSALVNAVHYEGRANRKEEQREDNENSLRDIITITILGLTLSALVATCIAIIEQVHEMRLAYPELQRAAKGALDQASAAKTQAETAKVQADSARDAVIASDRAWVGPNGATMDGVPAKGTDIKLHINYQNTGREPGRGFVPKVDPFIATAAELTNGTAAFRIAGNLDTCRLSKPVTGTQVVYPTSGFSSNSQNVTIDKSGIDDQLISGASMIFVVGCFSYETFGQPHYSAFCFYYKNGFTPLPNLNFCAGGSDAN
jgi:hypothetical protein